MINWLMLPEELQEAGLARYMDYPIKGSKRRYVIQHHWRGRSVHKDFRMEMNDHLNGWTILDNPAGTPQVETMEEAKKAYHSISWAFDPKNPNRGLRAETKARQPKEWITVEGVTKAGDVGATKEEEGVLHIADHGTFWEGAQKPYFHEYFLKSDQENGIFPKGKWTRVVIRAVNVATIDPETKLPGKGKELMWRAMIPGEQTAYALKRGLRKQWKAPKGVIPIPPDQRNGELWEKWLEFMKGKKAPEEKSEELSKYPFRVHMLSWMGQIVVRGVPHVEYYLRIKTPDGIRSFLLNGNPLYESPLAGEDEGKVNKRWFDFEGKVPPLSTYNPNKKIPATFTIIDKGTVGMTEEKGEDNIKILNLQFAGRKIHGKWRLVQEEKGMTTWTLEHLSEILSKSSFALQKHYGDKINTHYDVRISEGFEFNIYGQPPFPEGSGVRSVLKHIKNVAGLRSQWMNITKSHTFRLVGPLATYVDPIDNGSVDIIENTPNFVSMRFHGSKLKGYYVYRKMPSGEGKFEHSRLPTPQSLAEGDPNKSAFDPFRMIKKQGWDYYWLEIFDSRMFSRCADSKEYLPNISFPDYVLQALVCLYPRPGTLSGARLAKLKIKGDTPLGTVSSWIRSNKLHTWQGSLIRHETKSQCGCSEDLSESIGDPLIPEYWKVRVSHWIPKPQEKDPRQVEIDKLDGMIDQIKQKMTKSPS